MNRFNALTRLYALFGNPVTHSLSPFIHETWLNFYQINAVYLAFTLDNCHDLKTSMLKLKIAGANVTVPFKEAVFPQCEPGDDSASKIGSINTLKCQGNDILGFNTDIYGIETTFNSIPNNFDSIIILGAGGVAKTLLYFLKSFEKHPIYLYNRTQTKAEYLQSLYPQIQLIETPSKINDIQGKVLLINAGSSGIGNTEFFLSIKELHANIVYVFDMNYSQKDTDLVRQAKDLKITACDGKLMLLSQAAKSFELWHGFLPDIKLISI